MIRKFFFFSNNFCKLITLSGFFNQFDHIKQIFVLLVWPNGPGLPKRDNIIGMITLTVITLSGTYCICIYPTLRTMISTYTYKCTKYNTHFSVSYKHALIIKNIHFEDHRTMYISSLSYLSLSFSIYVFPFLLPTLKEMIRKYKRTKSNTHFSVAYVEHLDDMQIQKFLSVCLSLSLTLSLSISHTLSLCLCRSLKHKNITLGR